MLRNAQLAKCLAETREAIDKAKSLEDLQQALRSFNSPLKFNNHFYYVCMVFGALAAGALGHHFLVEPIIPFIEVFYLLLVVLAVGIVGVVMVWRRRNKSTSLVERLRQRNLWFHLNLCEQTVDAVADAKKLAAQFKKFDRGNHSRKIEMRVSGRLPGQHSQALFEYFHFHYVDKRTRQTSNNRGSTDTQTDYYHYHRYGIWLDFGLSESVAIASFPAPIKGAKYTTASTRFNKRFKVVASEKFAAAKLLKPAVVELLETATAHFKKLNLEINNVGHLCISFESDDLLTPLGKASLEDLDGLMQELVTPPRLPHYAAFFMLGIYCELNSVLAWRASLMLSRQ